MLKNHKSSEVARILEIDYVVIRQIIKHLGMKERRNCLTFGDMLSIETVAKNVKNTYGKVTLVTVNEYFEYHRKENQR